MTRWFTVYVYYCSLLLSEEVKQTPEKVETVSQALTNKIHGQPTITLQHSRESEKVYKHYIVTKN